MVWRCFTEAILPHSWQEQHFLSLFFFVLALFCVFNIWFQRWTSSSSHITSPSDFLPPFLQNLSPSSLLTGLTTQDLSNCIVRTSKKWLSRRQWHPSCILHSSIMRLCAYMSVFSCCFTARIRSEQRAPRKRFLLYGGLRPRPCMRGCKRGVLVGPSFTQGPKGSRGSSGSRGSRTSERGRNKEIE